MPKGIGYPKSGSSPGLAILIGGPEGGEKPKAKKTKGGPSKMGRAVARDLMSAMKSGDEDKLARVLDAAMGFGDSDED